MLVPNENKYRKNAILVMLDYNFFYGITCCAGFLSVLGLLFGEKIERSMKESGSYSDTTVEILVSL